jgi:hypothetical protein
MATVQGETEKRVESVKKIIEEASALALIVAKEQSIRVNFELDLSVDRVLVDKIQIQQVLLNLLRNAIEAMQNSARRELMISTRPAMDDMTVVTVADTGSGIPPDVMSKLLQPFVTTKAKGMGWGCRSRAQLSNPMAVRSLLSLTQTAERWFALLFAGSLPKCQNPNTRQQAFTDNVLLSEATDVYVPDRGGSSQRLEYWKVAENNHGRIVQPGALLDGSLVAFVGSSTPPSWTAGT